MESGPGGSSTFLRFIPAPLETTHEKQFNLINTTEADQDCAYGKHQRSPFPTDRIRAKYNGQLIHFDLCGPM
jgi:hypothetical protein